jgi:hypothetical protein
MNLSCFASFTDSCEIQFEFFHVFSPFFLIISHFLKFVDHININRFININHFLNIFF